MRKYVFLTFYLSLMMIVFACQQDKDPVLAEFYWNQTGCADPWDVQGSDSSDLKQSVESFLRKEGVLSARVVSVRNDGVGEGCYACHCKTGMRIYVSAPLSEKEKLIELGFIEN